MLFDLRGRGRQRAVKAIYLSLALLMGGGLIFFGVGGNVSGGLFDAFSENRGSDVNGAIQKRVDAAVQATRTQPRNARAYAELALARYQLAGASEGYDQQTGQFTGPALEQLRQATRAWERHLQLAGDKPNLDVAAQMPNAYLALGDAAKAARAFNLVVQARPDPGTGDFSRLAQLQYAAGNTRQGDLAADAAVRRAPQAQRKEIRQALEQVKTQALQQQAQGAAGAAGSGAAAGSSPTPVAP